MSSHRLVVDYWITADGWLYAATCHGCGWARKRANAAAAPTGHPVTVAIADHRDRATTATKESSTS